jgi:hypothetical protein
LVPVANGGPLLRNPSGGLRACGLAVDLRLRFDVERVNEMMRNPAILGLGFSGSSGDLMISRKPLDLPPEIARGFLDAINEYFRGR